MMNNEGEILTEIRRQAFIQADQRCREAQNRQDIQHTLEALQELTQLPRRELEAIAESVRACYEPEERDFFSVKNQFLMVSSGLALIGFFFLAFIR
jgi:hypothetical protein